MDAERKTEKVLALFSLIFIIVIMCAGIMDPPMITVICGWVLTFAFGICAVAIFLGIISCFRFLAMKIFGAARFLGRRFTV